ncbi:MAG: hypothetical protein KC996_04910 [Phycisphaerales bacterium]|nr:hypothetical protein [Phycisphaerales bacterium]
MNTSEQSPETSAKRGFTLVDLAALVVVCATVAAVAAPTLNIAKKQKFATTSERNLGIIGQGAAMYSAVNSDRIPTYSWEAGVSYTMPNGNIYTPISDQEAAGFQNQEILMRMTGRIALQNDGIRRLTSHLAHRRYAHLPLWDFMGPSIRPFIWADPADANLIFWQRHPHDYHSGSSVPYANGSPPFGYDQSSSWSEPAILQRWAFTTSYETVPAAWAPRMPDTYGPISETTNFYTTSSNLTPSLSNGRMMTEVAFPSRKVYMFEEFDRETFVDSFFAYSFAAPAKLMFDGSINTEQTGQARPAANPLNYPAPTVWRQRYIPLDTFPIPVTGLGESTELDMHYRWTFNGLLGQDYTP